MCSSLYCTYVPVHNINSLGSCMCMCVRICERIFPMWFYVYVYFIVCLCRRLVRVRLCVGSDGLIVLEYEKGEDVCTENVNEKLGGGGGGGGVCSLL